MNNILEGKLPVSRAKMASITKLALKAMKVSPLPLFHCDLFHVSLFVFVQYYKHIVMTVEKFVARVNKHHYKLSCLNSYVSL